MVKFKMINPQKIMETKSDVNFASTKISAVFISHTELDPIYINHLKIKGTLEGIGNTTANSAHLAIVKRIEGAAVVVNVYDDVTGKDASLMLDRVSKQVPLFVTGQINPTVPFSLTQKFMIKLRQGDTVALITQMNPGSVNYSASISYTRSRTVKRIVRGKRRN